MGLTLLTGLLFGLAPALQSTRVDLTSALKQTRAGEARKRIGAWLRVSLSQTLVVVADRGVAAAAGRGGAVRPHADEAELGRARLQSRASAALQRQRAAGGLSRPRRCPGSSTTCTQRSRVAFPACASPPRPSFALVSQSINSTGVTVPGYTGQRQDSRLLSVAPNFFDTMQIPDAPRPRRSTTRDVAAAAKVAVVNEVFAKTYFAGQNPIGQALHAWAADRTRCDFEIIGVAKNARYSLAEGRAAGCGVPAVHPRPAVDRLADLRAARGGRPDGAGRRGARDRAAGRLAHPGDRHPDAGGRDRPDHRAGADVRDALHGFRAAGGRDRVRRPVRHDGVQRRAADQRDRPADGARGRAADA